MEHETKKGDPYEDNRANDKQVIVQNMPKRIRKAGYGHTEFYEYGNYVEYGLIFHTYWKERFYNRLKLKNGEGKSYGNRSTYKEIKGWDRFGPITGRPEQVATK